VVPEIASRHHVTNLIPTLQTALDEAGATLDDVDGIAVTRGPGLVGALLVGVQAAKAMAWARGIPLVGVNHLEGHLSAVWLDGSGPSFPHLALLVSGGHSELVIARDHGVYELLGATRDDAAGEAFDKVAKLLGLGYPGGPVVDRLAKHGDPKAVKFPPSQIKGKDRRVREGRAAQTDFDFSFSGIKTAVLRYVETHGMQPRIQQRLEKLGESRKFEDVLAACDGETLDLVASFQRTVVRDLVDKTLDAAAASEVKTLFVTGGVAANSELRETFERDAAQQGLPVYFPSRPLSTDNAAMIAAAAYPKWLAQEFAPADLSAEAGLQLR
jgi:N6-L-threonylcarbamoyladenine synthase